MATTSADGAIAMYQKHVDIVARPREFGPQGKPDLKADAGVDISANDFNDLARQLGA